MSDEALDRPDPAEEDTLVPQAAAEEKEKPANGGWKMPDPVYRQTSGRLPGGFEKRTAPSAVAPTEMPTELTNNQGSAAALAPARAASPVLDIEPQPDIYDAMLPDDPPTTAARRGAPRNSALRLVMILLGLVAILAFLGVFLAVVYFLFLAPSPDTGTF